MSQHHDSIAPTVGDVLTVLGLFYKAMKIKIKNDSDSTAENAMAMQRHLMVHV